MIIWYLFWKWDNSISDRKVSAINDILSKHAVEFDICIHKYVNVPNISGVTVAIVKTGGVDEDLLGDGARCFPTFFFLPHTLLTSADRTTLFVFGDCCWCTAAERVMATIYNKQKIK